MSEKDGYQDYLNQTASAANAAGVVHDDPNVNARQARLSGGVGPAAFSGSGSALVGLPLAFLFLGSVVGYYVAFVDAFTRGGFHVEENMRTREFYQEYPRGTELESVGVLLENRAFDAGLMYILIAIGFWFLSRRIGYFLFTGIIMIPMIGIINPWETSFGEMGFGVPISLYLLAWLLGHPKYVYPRLRTH